MSSMIGASALLVVNGESCDQFSKWLSSSDQSHRPTASFLFSAIMAWTEQNNRQTAHSADAIGVRRRKRFQIMKVYKWWMMGDYCSGHARRGIQLTVHVSVTPINLPSHTHCRSVTARRWPASDGECAVAVLRRRSLDVLCAAVQNVASRALSRYSAPCRSVSGATRAASAVMWWLKSSSSARVMTTVLLEKCEAKQQHLIGWYNIQ